jgi:hypothetical protein
MSIIVLKLSKNYNDILNSYNRKKLILILEVNLDLTSSNDAHNEKNVYHLPISLMLLKIKYFINKSPKKNLMKTSQTQSIHEYIK